MITVKKVIVYSIFICSILKQFDSCAVITTEMKILAGAIKDATNTAVNGGQAMANTLGQASVDASTKFGAESAQIGLQAVEKITETGDKFAFAAGVCAGAYAFTQFWSIGKDVVSIGKSVKSYVSPSEEEKAHAYIIHEQYEFLKTKKEFRTCLLQKANTERGPSGRPQACEDMARLFAMTAGDGELSKLTKTFNKHYNK